jgi:GTP cyclohydrolase I
MPRNEDLETVRRLLAYIGEDPDREGLQETPARFLKAWEEYTRGYREKPEDILKSFEDGAQSVDEMVIVRDIPVYSLCEHHLAPFFGKAHVAYIPQKRIVGLSKIARVVDVFSRRLQVQERLTAQVAQALEEVLQPKGVGVVVEANHLCMMMRGVEKQNSSTVTSCLLGLFRSDERTRTEFLKLARGS